MSEGGPVPLEELPAAIPVLERPWAEARRLCQSGAPVYLYVNPVEFHGPHLSLHNDALVSAGLAADMHRRLQVAHPEWPFLLGGVLDAGVEPVPGPGTRDVSYTELKGLVAEACDALADLGAASVVLMSFHGAPLHNLALELGCRRLRKRGVPAVAPLGWLFDLLLERERAESYPGYAPILDPQLREELFQTFEEDLHAGYFETSLALHYAPESVDPAYRSLPPCGPIRGDLLFGWARRLALTLGARRLAGELHFAAVALGWYRVRPFPGYTSRPDLATAEAGRFFGERLAQIYADGFEAVLAGRARSPQPILAWTSWLTVQGRIPSPGRPG